MTMEKILAGDPASESLDVRADNIEKLKALFPELMTENANGPAINVDALKQLVGDATMTDAEEKYGLNWHGKRRARQLALTPSSGTLLPCQKDSVDWDTTKNLMIEGDNLEVLKLLQKSYAGKVNLIYIDPPYNTGKDFVYPDNFQDSIKNYMEQTGQAEGGTKVSSNTEASGRFHTDWLNMLYPRLKLGRNLLAEDGIMLVSIDDHEVENLRHICNEVYGEENFIACLIWEKSRKNDAKLISVGHEYILIYAKSLGKLKANNLIWREEKPGAREIWNEYLSLRKSHGQDDMAVEIDLKKWMSTLEKVHPSKKWSRYKHVDKYGPWRDDNISWPGGGGPRYDVMHPETKRPCAVPERGWVFAKPEKMNKMIELGIVEFREDHTEPPMRKSHLKPVDFELDENDDDCEESSHDLGEDDVDELATQVRGTYFYKQSQVTAKYMRQLFGSKVFDNPKDHPELARLFDYVAAGDESSLVLDFFAGSGSTAQAVMELNVSDGGSRRFILVQLPEQLDIENSAQREAAKLCNTLGRPCAVTELTKERVRRARANLKDDNPEYSGDTGFRVYQLNQSNIRAWQPTADLERNLLDNIDHIAPDRTEEDVITELLLKLGLDLCAPIEQRQIAGKTVHAIGGGVLLACLDTRVTHDDAEALALGIAKWHTALAPAGETTCVFRDSAFADDVAKTNLAAILEQHGIGTVRSL